ncbi:hypothetical protein CA267_005495 [Alteromonas pelagimontana]|uniref:Uncharacterized protein n=1 Tax=Alteromonas pelagimontana TaxID=1858656 RepID=A0A6M4MB84_9ALTE|nr:hypothetical protein [Alteromonas pelagimontana]QJR80269.1 hypothetical protein CA267_005495 [Alteromonas pelagimontana]
MKDKRNPLLERHNSLTHSEDKKVTSHVQRDEGEWIRHTLMLENVDVPFVFRRKKPYQRLVGARVNVTYYPQSEIVAGIEFEFMKVVRIRRA